MRARLTSRLQGRLSALGQRFRQAEQLNQAGRTPFEVIAERELHQVRYYPASIAKPEALPVVIIPPLAVNMLIYDLFPQRSLVADLQAQGHPVYLIDWGRPTRQQAHYRLATYLQDFIPEALAQIRSHAGQAKVVLHGWSLGAMFAYCYAALAPSLGDHDLAGLVLLGPPCDYHAVGPHNRLLARQLRLLERRTGWNVHKSPKTLWHVPGWANALGFKLLSPGGTVKGYLELLQRLDDREFIAAHATNAAFLDDMVAYPGGVMQDVLRYLVADNCLAKGRLPIRHCSQTLADVHGPVLIVVGDQDPIITPAASQKLIDLMPHATCTLLKVKGGHMSIVSGSQAPKAIWPSVREWVATLGAGG